MFKALLVAVGVIAVAIGAREGSPTTPAHGEEPVWERGAHQVDEFARQGLGEDTFQQLADGGSWAKATGRDLMALAD